MGQLADPAARVVRVVSPSAIEVAIEALDVAFGDH